MSGFIPKKPASVTRKSFSESKDSDLSLSSQESSRSPSPVEIEEVSPPPMQFAAKKGIKLPPALPKDVAENHNLNIPFINFFELLINKLQDVKANKAFIGKEIIPLLADSLNELKAEKDPIKKTQVAVAALDKFASHKKVINDSTLNTIAMTMAMSKDLALWKTAIKAQEPKRNKP